MAHVEFDQNTGWLKVANSADFAACPLTDQEAIDLASVLLQFATAQQRKVNGFKRLRED